MAMHPAEAHERALRGDFREVDAALDPLRRDRSPDGVAWHAALDTLYALVRREGRSVSPSSYTALGGGERTPSLGTIQGDPRAWAHAVSHGTLSGVLCADAGSVRAWAEVARRIPGDAGALAADIAGAWVALLAGDPPDAEPAERTAARAGQPAQVIEAAAIRALAAMDRGDLGEAVAIARRAARMARTEQLLMHEYLANVVLARVRRATGRAYLAARIASALAQVAPEPWRPWLEWELTLAGHRVPAATDVPQTPAELLISALDRAESGDRASFERVDSELRARTRGFAALAREADALLAMLDPAIGADRAGEAEAWCRGEAHEAPFGIRDRGAATHPSALIVWQAGRAPRRVMRSGLALAAMSPDALVAGDEAADDAGQKEGRTHAAIAALALAGPAGIGDRELFRAVYGFDLVPVKHDGVFRVLLHRVRTALGDAAAIDRGGERLVLVPIRTLVCPDPRTLLPLDERILGLLAAGHGRVTARQIADHLRIALRSVQTALGDLVETGACTMERDGRRVEYAVEDTTFYEPSLHRLASARAPG